MSIQFLISTSSASSKSIQSAQTIETSLIKIMQFPAGEIHLILPPHLENPFAAFIKGADLNDLMALGLWANVIKNQNNNINIINNNICKNIDNNNNELKSKNKNSNYINLNHIHLNHTHLNKKAIAFLPYLPAARADKGLPLASQVYAKIINSFELDQIICFDPHSSIAPSMYSNLTILDSTEVIRDSVFSNGLSDYIGIISPDKGAILRAQKIADWVGLPLFKAEKQRDFQTGRLSGFQCETLPQTKNGRFLVVDDICDGGGTFIGLAKSLAENQHIKTEQLSLWISHAIFSGSAFELKNYYSEIYTSDSCDSANHPLIQAKITPLLPYLMALI